MKGFAESTYGDRIADIYDELHADISGPEHVDPVVNVLAELAGGGRALELGVGTGRIALPLAERGIEVHGIDASDAMLQVLRQKPGGIAMPATSGDFVEVEVEGKFSLIYAVFNTFFSALTQERQLRCFKNVAGRLGRRGVFVIEVFVPDLERFKGDRSVGVSRVEADLVSLSLSRHDPIAQTVTTSHLHIEEERVRLLPVKVRYAWPSELDLMAELAGLKLRHRASDWQGSAFTSSSTNHVSVYEKR